MILTRENPVFRNALLKRAAALVPGAVDVGVVGSYLKAANPVSENGGWEIEGIATTDDTDCEDEVVLPDGLDWSAFEQYKSIYLDHWYGTDRVVATRRWVKRIGNGWQLRCRVMKSCEEGPRLVELAREQALGMSIGFVPMDRGQLTADERKRYPEAASIVRKASVFEVSLTSMPCNMRCTTAAMWVDESKSAKLAEMVLKGRIPADWARQRRTLMLV